MRILVMGLLGSGKTTLADPLSKILRYKYLNGDEVRNLYSDWDFSIRGRIRQAARMRTLSSDGNSVCDFVCPLEESRIILSPDIIIYLDNPDTTILLRCLSRPQT